MSAVTDLDSSIARQFWPCVVILPGNFSQVGKYIDAGQELGGLQDARAVFGQGRSDLYEKLILKLEAALLARFGTTPGKRLLGLVVTTEDGARPTFERALGRSLRVAL